MQFDMHFVRGGGYTGSLFFEVIFSAVLQSIRSCFLALQLIVVVFSQPGSGL